MISRFRSSLVSFYENKFIPSKSHQSISSAYIFTVVGDKKREREEQPVCTPGPHDCDRRFKSLIFQQVETGDKILTEFMLSRELLIISDSTEHISAISNISATCKI